MVTKFDGVFPTSIHLFQIKIKKVIFKNADIKYGTLIHQNLSELTENKHYLTFHSPFCFLLGKIFAF